MNSLADEHSTRHPIESFTQRELAVLQLLVNGHSNREIAARLSISSHTAGHHLRHIYDKVGVSTRAAATLFAMQHDLLTEAALARESEAEIARSRDAADRRCS